MDVEWHVEDVPTLSGDETFSDEVLQAGIKAITDANKIPSVIVFNNEGFADYETSDIRAPFRTEGRVFGIRFRVDPEAEHRYAFYGSTFAV
jgi:hypothetical protein